MARTKTRKRYATHVTTPSGERVYLSATSKAELDRKVLEAKMESMRGVDITNHYTFAEYARLWLKTYKAPPKVKETTYSRIEHKVEHVLIPYLGDIELRRMVPMDIHSAFARMNFAVTVRRDALAQLRAILDAAVGDKLIPDSPLPKDFPIEEHIPEEKEPLSDEQARRLLASMAGTPTYLFCLIALQTGMRRGEILGLRWDAVDLENRTIEVRRNRTFTVGKDHGTVESESTKTRSGHRFLPIPDKLLEALTQEKQASRSSYIIHNEDGTPLENADFNALWRRVTRHTASADRPLGKHFPAKRAKNGHMEPAYDVDLDFPCTAHLLRHTFITQLFEADLDIKQVQYLAGHANPEMTLRVYTHFRRHRREETRDLVIDALNKVC